MIRNKQDLKDYLQRDSTRFGFQYMGGVRNTFSNLLANPASDNRIVWKYIYTLRHCEYYINVPKHNVFQKAAYMVCKLYYLRRLRHLGYITGFQIPPNTCGPGLTIFHYGTIIVGNATLGENCTLFPGVLIGKKTSTGRSANIGNNVYICSGTKIIGDITIGDNVTIGQNCVIVKDIPSDSVVVTDSRQLRYLK